MMQSKLSPNGSGYAPWITNSNNQCAGTGSCYTSNSVIFTSHTQFNSSKNTWIIDSGATPHITPYIDLIDNPKSVSSELHLPNGVVSIVSHIGNVHLTSTIVLKDILVVPTFQYNLISVPQLTNSLPCTILFSSTKCILQAPALIMEKEIGELEESLYKLSSLKLQSHFCSSAHTTTVLSHSNK